MLRTRPLHVLLALAVSSVVAPVVALQGAAAQDAPPLAAAGTVPTATTLSGPARYADTNSPLDIAVTPTDGGAPPVPDGSPVTIERRVNGTWQVMATPATTGGHATAPATLSRDASDNVFRATYAGDATYAGSVSAAVRVPLKVRGTRIGLGGPDKVVDEQTVTLRVFWRTGKGIPVPGRVNLYRRSGKKWVRHAKGSTGADGRTTFKLKPRTDSRWQVRGLKKDWVKSATSSSHVVDNRPPGVPVRLPKGAPSPRVRLPEQPHGVGVRAERGHHEHPQRVWNQMTGVTWHPRLPGRPRRAALSSGSTTGTTRATAAAASWSRRPVRSDRISRGAGRHVRAKLPIRSMYRVDRFGYSRGSGAATTTARWPPATPRSSTAATW